MTFTPLPPPLDAEQFVHEVLTALVPVGTKVKTQWDLAMFESTQLPAALAIVFQSILGDDGRLETVTFDLDTIADNRKDAADLAGNLVRALEMARRNQTVFPHGWISRVRVAARPVRIDAGGNVNRVDGRVLGDPKSITRYTARIALTVRPA